MKNITKVVKMDTVKLSFVAIVAAVVVVFAVLPLLPQVDSKLNTATLKTTIVAAFGGDGGSDGGGGGDGGGGCCGGGDGDGPDGGGGETTPPPPPPAPDPKCDMGPNQTINRGDSAKISWTTQNAGYVHLKGGGYNSEVGKNGNKNVSPDNTTTYRIGAKYYEKVVYCTQTITVKIPPPPPPQLPAIKCTLDADKNTINEGESAKLTWTSDGASSATLTGSGSVSKNGNTNVSPNKTTTYTFEAKGAAGTKTCKETVTVIPKTDDPEPRCTLSVDPNAITKGGSATLTWTTEHLTSVTISPLGAVALSGNETVSPTENTTYTLTGTGPYGEVVPCEDTITVTDEPVTSCDLFDAAPKVFTGSGTSTLTWETTNANEVSINNGIGVVAADGSLDVNVTESITYALSVLGTYNDDNSCTVELVVNEEPGAPKCDSLVASPKSFTGSGTTTLTWETTNANDVSIDQGIGAVDADGTIEVFITDDTTFTLTASDGETSHTCVEEVTVSTNNGDPLSCDSFTASPKEVNRAGQSSTLTWTTTGADSVSINQGVGDVPVDGSKEVVVNAYTTYTLTATRGDRQATCQATVSIDSGGGGGGSPSPRCRAFEIEERLPNGDVVLYWRTSNGRDMTIEPNILQTSDDDEIDEGRITITPKAGTKYVLTVERGSKDDTCELEEDIVLLVDRERQPLTSISFTEIPYTGFEAGPMLTALFYGVLVLWSLGIAYIIVVKKGSVFGYSLANVRGSRIVRKDIHGAQVDTNLLPHKELDLGENIAPVAASAKAAAPVNLPTDLGDIAELYGADAANVLDGTDPDADDKYAYLEEHAHEKNVLLSSDAIRLIVDEEHEESEQLALLDSIIARAKENYPKEDGWLVVNRERITELLKHTKAEEKDAEPKAAASGSWSSAPKDSAPKNNAAADVAAPTSPMRKEHQAEREVTKTEAVSQEANGASELTLALLSSDLTRAYRALGEAPMQTVVGAASELDALYRAKKGVSVNVATDLMQIGKNVSAEALMGAIDALTEAIEGVYQDEHAAVKVAIIKAVKAIG